MIERFDPPALKAIAERSHFSSAVRAGDTIWVSGTVGILPSGEIAEGMTAQARVAFEHLRASLAEAGASLADVVELMTFHTALRADIRAFSKAKDEVFPDAYPAWTAVGVSELALPGLLVEIRAVAVAGSGSPTQEQPV